MSSPPTGELVLVFDFGSQYAQLIARRVRDLNVFCQIVRHDLSAARVAELNPKGIILSGGPASVYEPGAPTMDPAIFGLGVPILGLCYGMHIGCQILGGEVIGSSRREFGRAPIRIADPDIVLAGIPRETIVWMSHGDQVRAATRDFETLASTDTCPVAAVKHRSKPFFGFQFHPEVSHTPEGGRMLRNFLHDVCGCQGLWKMQTFIDRTIADVRERVGKSRVICGLSGGVDSSVVAALLLRAIGPQVACIFVDNGLLREGEAESVKHTFRDWYQGRLAHGRRSGPISPSAEGRARSAGKAQVDRASFHRSVSRGSQVDPGREIPGSGHAVPGRDRKRRRSDGPAATIKTHHNVGGLPAELGFELIEPLRDLFKDEVRKLGNGTRTAGDGHLAASRSPDPASRFAAWAK